MAENADELAKKRIEEEMKKIQLETEEKRKAKMKALIGDDAVPVEARKKGVDESVQKWSEKGTHQVEEPDIKAGGHAGETLKSMKDAFEKHVQEDATKGKSATTAEGEGEAPLDPEKAEEIRKRFAKPKSDVPEGGEEPEGGGGGEDDEDAEINPEEAAFREGFSSIESEETTMVGLEKHVRITGTDLEGRKFTKTKIFLPKVEGKTVLQGKQPAKEGEPPNWDGHFHALEDIQQLRVEGMDKQHREMYLSPEDFEKYFKMTKGAFAKLPKWKKSKLKKDLLLF
ncbi:unnamed protein product [Cylindrotheca closterium]|uniref:HP domain-containing protein n=1 Tax=Cylindrotheca closterium TaxID=2856 RepID=A0AAD2G2X5_9STRA|nr:unnamed protein product [Cylindrotheca closterium]